MIDGFNIRVYGVCVRNGNLLTLSEPFMGKVVVKLPGGGLEYGEGPVDCLKREFEEELGILVTVKESFYIQETYVTSLAKNNKQIVMLYFLVEIPDETVFNIGDANIQEVAWRPITEPCALTLPVDQSMYQKLLKVYQP